MYTQPSSSNRDGGSTGAEDIEMGAKVDELDDTLGQQSLLETEEQSLLEKEIRARRLQRAPKAKQKLLAATTSISAVSSSMLQGFLFSKFS